MFQDLSPNFNIEWECKEKKSFIAFLCQPKGTTQCEERARIGRIVGSGVCCHSPNRAQAPRFMRHTTSGEIRISVKFE